MTESDEDLAARLRAAQKRLQQAVESTRKESSGAAETKARWETLIGRASSGDGGVTATVDRTGALTGLELTAAVGRLGPHQLAKEILTCAKKAQANLAGQAREQLSGLPFGDRIAEDLAQRYPEPAEPRPPAPNREMPLGRLHEEAAAAKQPVRTPRRVPEPEIDADEGFGGSVFTRGDR